MFGSNQPPYGPYYIPWLIGRAIGSAWKAFADAYHNALGSGNRRVSVAEQLARQRLRITIGWLVVLFGFFAVQMRNLGVGQLAWCLGILAHMALALEGRHISADNILPVWCHGL